MLPETKGYIWFRVLVCSAIRFLRDTETTLRDKILISYSDACCNQYNNNWQTNHTGLSRTISKLIYSDLRPPRFFCPPGGCRHIVQSSQSSASKSWLQAGTEQSRGKPQTWRVEQSSTIEKRCNDLKRCCSGRCLVRRSDWRRPPRLRKRVLAVNVPPPLLLLWALFGQLNLYHNETPAVCLQYCYSTCHWHRISMSLFFALSTALVLAFFVEFATEYNCFWLPSLCLR